MYVLIIWVSSSLPDPESTFLANSPFSTAIGAIPFKDKFQHAIIYFFMGILLLMAINHTRYPTKRYTLRVNGALSLLAGSIYGAIDEMHQHFVPMRSMDVLDLLTDVFGLVCGIYLVYILSVEHEDYATKAPRTRS
jgi:VanZ family protein